MCAVYVMDKLLTKLDRIMDSYFTGRNNWSVLLDYCSIFLRSDRWWFPLLNRKSFASRLGGSQATGHATDALLCISHRVTGGRLYMHRKTKVHDRLSALIRDWMGDWEELRYKKNIIDRILGIFERLKMMKRLANFGYCWEVGEDEEVDKF